MVTATARALMRRYVPGFVRRFGRAVGLRPGKSHVAVAVGVIEDLSYWVADGRLDTLLPIQNYFSVLFPDLETGTTGYLHIYDRYGRAVGLKTFDLGPHCLVKLRLGAVLSELGVWVPDGYGTLRWDLRIPDPVVRRLDPKEPFYFWDRSYVGYLSADLVPCFVHGVDKTYLVDHEGRVKGVFYPAGRRYTWNPELPVDLTLYRRFSVILVNRTEAPAHIMLAVSDPRDLKRQWSAEIAPLGVHRFDLSPTDVRDLIGEELRLRIDGMSTQWGRPVVFKEFSNGAISAMHC